jgi:hypothetical protein
VLAWRLLFCATVCTSARSALRAAAASTMRPWAGANLWRNPCST